MLKFKLGCYNMCYTFYSNFFLDFSQEDIRSNKLDNLNLNISRFISTEQRMTVMDLKILHTFTDILVSIL